MDTRTKGHSVSVDVTEINEWSNCKFDGPLHLRRHKNVLSLIPGMKIMTNTPFPRN